jgi:hypothetical protein
MNIGETKSIRITKQRNDDNPQLAVNVFDCPACGQGGAVASQKWDLTQSLLIQCESCRSTFMFTDDCRYPLANVRIQNLGPGVK